MSLTHFFINYYYSHYTHSLGLPSQREPSSPLFLTNLLGAPSLFRDLQPPSPSPPSSQGFNHRLLGFSSWAVVSPWLRWISLREWEDSALCPTIHFLSGISGNHKGSPAAPVVVGLRSWKFIPVSLTIHLLGRRSYFDFVPHLFATVAALDGFQSRLVIPRAAMLG